MQSTAVIELVRDNVVVNRRVTWGTLDGKTPTLDDHIVHMLSETGEVEEINIYISPGAPMNIDPTMVKTLVV